MELCRPPWGCFLAYEGQGSGRTLCAPGRKLFRPRLSCQQFKGHWCTHWSESHTGCCRAGCPAPLRTTETTRTRGCHKWLPRTVAVLSWFLTGAGHWGFAASSCTRVSTVHQAGSLRRGEWTGQSLREAVSPRVGEVTPTARGLGLKDEVPEGGLRDSRWDSGHREGIPGRGQNG